MTKSARQIVFEAMELLPEALAPYVEGRLAASLSGHWRPQVAEKLPGLRTRGNGEIAWDQQSLLKTMDRLWTESFRQALGRSDRSYVIHLADVRNQLSHNEDFSLDNAERALDSMRRLMQSIGAEPVASRITAMRDEVLRTRLAEGKPAAKPERAASIDTTSESPKAKPRKRRSMGTTEPGYLNKNGQVVVRKTDLQGNDHNARLYVLRCTRCGNEYGANGTDIFQRRCPKCDGGMPGLPY